MSKNSRIILILYFLLINLFATFYIKDFRIDASSDTLIAQNDKDYKYFNEYQKIFTSNNNLVVAIKSVKEIDKNLLNEINIISKKISKIKEVASIFNINKAPILFLNETTLVELSNNNFETILNSEYEIDKVLEEFSQSPIYSDQLINNNKNITSLIIFLKPNKKLNDLKINKNKYLDDKSYYSKKSEIDKERNKLISDIRTILKDANRDYEYYLGGVEMISSDVISFVKSDILIFSLLVLILVLIILFVIFQKIKWVIVVLISSVCSVYTMVGVTGFLNFEITAVSANFLSLMFILSISMNIHILNNYLQTNNNLKQTLQTMFWPCFYTFLTTVVAFLSLVISDIKPVIDFGIVMIIALIVVLISSFTILPLMISFFSKDVSEKIIKFSIINFFINYSNKYKSTILFVNLLLFLISMYGISNLNVENSFIKYFKKDTEIYKGMRLIDKELGGTTPLDLIINFEKNEIIHNNNIDSDTEDEIEFEEDIFSDDLFEQNNEVWFTNDKINIIKNIHKYLESRQEIGKVISIYSLIDIANKINKSELSTFELSVLYNEIPENYKEDLIYPYLNIENNMAKITARIKDSEDIKRGKLIDEIKVYSSNLLENKTEIKINGLLVLYNNMLSTLFSSQIKSLGFVLLAIFIMFFILFKSLKLSIIGIIPNILASSFILGFIGLLKIPLDIMTITIAAISIGIAVDNTIHYLYRYKTNLLQNIKFDESIKKTHSTVGKAVLITSITISFGFLVLCFSNFVPTIIFGVFTSLAMLFAMIGVLITLPSMLYYLK